MQPFLEYNSNGLRIHESAAEPFPEHLHTQMELLYLFEGSATLTVNRQLQHMQPGDLCVCFPGVIHGYQSSDRARALMLIFPPDFSAEFPALLERAYPADPLLRNAQLPADVAFCMAQMCSEYKGAKDERVLLGYLQVILARLLPLLSLVRRESGDSDMAYEIVRYLSEHFAEPLSLDSLSTALGVSHSSLSHTFSQRIGIHFRTYLNTLRADRACILLRSSARSISDIAYDCGFETVRTFNRVFTQLYGQTPTDYRKHFFPE